MNEFTWREVDGVSWLDTRLPGARAVFSSRRGGASAAPYESLNLGVLTEDRPENVIENRRRLAAALGRDPDGVVMGHQVHGAEVRVHSADDGAGGERNGAFARGRADLVPSDVQVSTAAQITPLVLVADCFPLAASAPGIVAMAHCGWRGTAAGAVRKAVEAVCLAGRSGREEVHAALGPGIGACCYEIGPEVAETFRRAGHETAVAGGRLDLARVIEAELERCGVDAGRFADCGLCTACNPAHFFSHRRDRGTTGRQAGLAWLDS